MLSVIGLQALDAGGASRWLWREPVLSALFCLGGMLELRRAGNPDAAIADGPMPEAVAPGFRSQRGGLRYSYWLVWSMPLSVPVTRVMRHRRAIMVEAYSRQDGLWDIEAHLTDTKPRDIPLSNGEVRAQGLPLHDLWLRVTIDTQMNIVDAQACSDWVPYPTHCDTIGPAYRNLIGLNLMQGFRRAARARLGGIAGCTHLTELCGVLPTVAIQAFAGEVSPRRDRSNDHRPIAPGEKPPAHLQGCHALRLDGAVVREYYPRWFGFSPEPGPQAPSAQPPSSSEPSA